MTDSPRPTIQLDSAAALTMLRRLDNALVSTLEAALGHDDRETMAALIHGAVDQIIVNASALPTPKKRGRRAAIKAATPRTPRKRKAGDVLPTNATETTENSGVPF